MRIDDKSGRTIAAAIMSAWTEYQENYYPKDPRCYVIRVHPSTAATLLLMQDNQYRFHDNDKEIELSDRRFMWFKLEEDYRLDEDEIYFGPELIRIEWSHK